MHFKRTISIVDCHCAGEVDDVIVGGVLDPSGCATMYDKLVHFRDKADHIRQLLLIEPRGRPAICRLFDHGKRGIPTHVRGNIICTATMLLDTGMVEMRKPVIELLLDTAAGPVSITVDCENEKCTAVAFHSVPSFVFVLDHPAEVPGLGTVSVDIAWGGMIYAIVDATKLGVKIENRNGPKLIKIGERIKQVVQQSAYVPVHPENSKIRGVSILEFTEPLTLSSTAEFTAVNTVVVSPGRFDRCPCGTGSSARMAVLHAQGQLKVGERFQHRSIIGSSFECCIEGTTQVGS
ncbi:proline racemase family protein [Aspergillus homomorphus CBS 101889]|uniref:Proline racemase n=1 Tax=Aspergillus homomorphus (strain CBS 101889) TaxID=1450537 RepID=A0A395I7L9_ASPHC|nr:proline racemase [Aspergillus homomorphus CBS 101889]RAL14194.1 proline racemase [Aspergillus homomorphus CBS 101889]